MGEGAKMPGAAEPKLMPVGGRKLMPMGNGGLVVTVPKFWARLFQLKVGDTVELAMDSDGELHIRPKGATRPDSDRGDGEES